MKAVTDYESKYLSGREKLPNIRPGMEVRVHQKIKEADDKERIQMFEGLVIKVQGSTKLNRRITVRKMASGVGVEKIFPLHSPVIAKFEVVNAFKVRRANLVHVREMTKADKLKEDREGFKKVQKAFEKAENDMAEAVKAQEKPEEAKAEEAPKEAAK
jgi:large subunit ribosomal protein L19